MLNRHVKELQDLWEAILKDASRSFPALGVEFERDLYRLRRLVIARGIRVFLEDLVQVGKHLDRCLSDGEYSPSGLPLTKRFSGGVVIPKFLRGLYLLVFDKSGQLKEDCDVEAIFFLRQLLLAFRKGKLDCTRLAQEQEVLEFYRVDSDLPEPEKFWQIGSDRLIEAVSGDEGTGNGHPSPDSNRLLPTPSGEDGRREPDETAATGRVVPPEMGGQSQPVANPIAVAIDLSGRLQRTGNSHVPREGFGPCEATVPSGARIPNEDMGGGGLIAEGFSNTALYQGRVRSQPADVRGRLSDLLAKLDLVSGFVTAALGPYDPSVWRFRHGPGAVSEYRGPANKFCWTQWSDTLESEYPIADYGFHSYSSWASRHSTGRDISSCELSSRMVCVPKTFSKPRLIAAEPSANQWCQQNLWHYFRVRTDRSWLVNFVRFGDQRLNQELCLKGSKDGSLATIDLSSASDRVTCTAVGRLFRSNPKLLRALRATRTQSVSQNVTAKVPSVIRLRKFSTMGNAVTFPVETLLFLSVAIACVLTVRRRRVTLRNIEALTGEVAIFGDDIIVPVDSRELVEEALEVLDFKVNVAKTHWKGNFRESCGVDAFRGEDITPAHWRIFNDGKPVSLASTVATSNNFYKRFLLNAAASLASTTRRDIPVVTMGSGVFGLECRTGAHIAPLKMRFNRHLFRHEVWVARLQGRQPRTEISDDSALLQFFTEFADPAPFSRWQAGYPQRPSLKIRPGWVPLQDLLEREDPKKRREAMFCLEEAPVSPSDIFSIMSE